MSRNKKVFKYQRKQMLVSNPLGQPAALNAMKQVKVCKEQIKQVPMSIPMHQVSNDKLEIPKQMRMDNIAHKARSRLVAIMDSHPLFEVDTLFENETVCLITGIMAKRNRDSFSNKVKEQDFQQIIPSVHGYILPPDTGMKHYPIPQQYQQPQANYLEMLSDGMMMKHIPLQQAFESSQDDELEREGAKIRQIDTYEMESTDWPRRNNMMMDAPHARINRRAKKYHNYNNSNSTGVRFY